MYPVSNAFQTAIESNTRSFYWTGTITTAERVPQTYDFTDADIVKGSGSIQRQCCGSSEIELGTVYASELNITLYSDVDRYTLEGAVIRLYFHLKLDDETYETVPMGVYEISEANRKINCLELTAYDYMLRFDEPLNLASSSGNAYAFINMACTACHVEMKQSREDFAAMPNGREMLGVYENNDMESWRDLIYYVAQVVGCFCRIDREGKLELVPYVTVADVTIPATQRFSSSYSDFITRYTAVSSTNKITETAEYYHLPVDDGLTMNLGVNPLLQFGLQATRDRIITAILNAIAVVNYVPFDSSTIGNPAIDPGDIVAFSGGHADSTKVSCVTSITYSINGKHTLKGVGKNPRLAKSKSKNDKNITGLINQLEQDKTVVYSFMNADAYTIDENRVEVCYITFTSKERTTAMFWGEFLLDITPDSVVRTIDGTATYEDELAVVDEGEITEQTIVKTVTKPVRYVMSESGKAVLKVTYYLNGNEVDTFYPEETCFAGKHIVTLYFPVPEVVENSQNTLTVYFEMTGGTATIAEMQARGTVSGQGLVAGAGDWDGRIVIYDDLALVPLLMPDITEVDDDGIEFSFDVSQGFGVSESIGTINLNQYTIAYGRLNESRNISEVHKSFTMDYIYPGTYDHRYIKLNSSDAFCLNTDYEYTGETESIDSGTLQRVSIDTAPFDTVSSVEVSICQ